MLDGCLHVCRCLGQVSDVRAKLPMPGPKGGVLLVLCDSPWLVSSAVLPVEPEPMGLEGLSLVGQSGARVPVPAARGTCWGPCPSQPPLHASIAGASRDPQLLSPPKDMEHEQGTAPGGKLCQKLRESVRQGNEAASTTGTLDGGVSKACAQEAWVRDSELLAGLLAWKATATREARGDAIVEVVIMTAGLARGIQASVLDLSTGASIKYLGVASSSQGPEPPMTTVPTGQEAGHVLACWGEDDRCGALHKRVLQWGTIGWVRVLTCGSRLVAAGFSWSWTPGLGGPSRSCTWTPHVRLQP